jgi:protocatechuate 3,4-dioxygenase beta subunit
VKPGPTRLFVALAFAAGLVSCTDEPTTPTSGTATTKNRTPPTPEPPGSAKLRGRIVDDFGVALAGVVVHVMAADTQLLVTGPPRVDENVRSRITATTDAGGVFLLEPPDGGTLVIVARHPHFAPRVLRVASKPGQATANRDLGDLTLVSCPGLLVEVRGDSDIPLAGARVGLEPDLTDAALPPITRERSTVTDTSGIATFYGITPGPWTVTVTAEGRATTLLAHAQLGSPESSPRAMVGLPPGRTLTGRLTGSAGEPVPGALIRATGITRSADPTQPRHPPMETQTDAEGAFRLTGLIPGVQQILVPSDSHGCLRRDGVDPDAGTLNLRLPRGFELRGRVLYGRTKRPFAGAVVTARGTSGWPSFRDGPPHRPRATTDEDGKFHFRGLPGGILTLLATSKGLSPAVSGPLEPTAPGGVQSVPSTVTLLLEEGFRVTGQILSPTGLPLEDAVIRAALQPSEDSTIPGLSTRRTSPVPVRSRVGGRFEVAGLHPGRYRLEVSAPGLPVIRTAIFSARANAQLEIGALRLAHGGTVSGTAFDAAGRPAAFAAVQLRPETGRDAPAATGPDLARRTAHTVRTDASGQFRLPPVASGSYRMFYDYPDRETPRAAAETRAATGVTVRAENHAHQRQDLRPRVR